VGSSSTNGNVMACPDNTRGTRILHQGSPPRLVQTGPQPEVRSCDVSPDGALVVAASNGRGSISVWDAERGALVKELAAVQGPVKPHGVGGLGCATKFSPDGRWLVIQHFAACELWRVRDWQRQWSREGWFLGAAFTPDSSLLAVSKADEEGQVRLLRTESGAEVVRLFTPDHTRIVPLAFTPDGGRVCAWAENNFLYVWDLARIRPQLRELGLDWDNEPLPPPRPIAREPLVVKLDYDVAAPVYVADHIALHIARADGLLSRGDKKGALAAARKTVELYPRSAAAQVALGRLLLNTDRAGAVAACRKAVELNPQYADASFALGLVLSWPPNAPKKDLEAARDAFARVIELEPKNNAAWCNRGNMYRRLGQPDNARADYDKAIALVPGHPQAFYGIGELHFESGEWEKAITAYSVAAKSPALKAPGLYRRGQAYQQWRKWDQAVADYDKAVRLWPQNATWQNDLAWLLATCPDPKTRAPQRAVELARSAADRMPSEGTYWNTLGAAQYRAGDWKAAIAAFDRSMELRDGGDAHDWFFLAMTYHKLGNAAEARKRYDQAVAWMAKNGPALARNAQVAEELGRFRSEAEDVLELKKK
jgi:tetratricopeptide (TPR) repeat protein